MANNPKRNIDTATGTVVPYINAYTNAYQTRFDKVLPVSAEQRTPPVFLMPDPYAPQTEEDSD